VLASCAVSGEGGGRFEATDFTDCRDGEFFLLLPEGMHVTLSLDTKVRQFLIAYIMYRWLETKVPQDAAIYAERAERLKDGVRDLLTVIPDRRPHGYW
jgi:hypothetical protein